MDRLLFPSPDTSSIEEDHKPFRQIRLCSNVLLLISYDDI